MLHPTIVKVAKDHNRSTLINILIHLTYRDYRDKSHDIMIIILKFSYCGTATRVTLNPSNNLSY